MWARFYSRVYRNILRCDSCSRAVACVSSLFVERPFQPSERSHFGARNHPFRRAKSAVWSGRLQIASHAMTKNKENVWRFANNCILLHRWETPTAMSSHGSPTRMRSFYRLGCDDFPVKGIAKMAWLSWFWCYQPSDIKSREHISSIWGCMDLTAGWDGM